MAGCSAEPLPMMRFAVLLLLAAPFLVSCSNPRKPYTPSEGFEQIEYRHATVGVYPDEIRANLDKYTNMVVAWAGIVKDTRARDLISGQFEVATLVEHHYFNWEENRKTDPFEYFVSPRGEGQFKFKWESPRESAAETTADIDKYAGPGKMIVVYGIPKSVDADGTINLNYRFLRVINATNCNFYTYTYGRAGEAYKYTGK
jgi:hypothetical protein